MCTVTLVPTHDRLQVVCNRDERHERSRAYLPSRQWFGLRQGVAPVDPDGGGSWIGVNDAGLAVALLNRPSRLEALRPNCQSRGVIVMELLRVSTLDAVRSSLSTVDAFRVQPFRLLAIQRRRAVIADVRRNQVVVRRYDLSRPRLLTSSSFDPLGAAAARGALFRAIVVAACGDRRNAQRAFHHHQLPGRHDVSVLMSRSDARTVSRTTLDLADDGASLTYECLDSSSRVVRCDLPF